MGVEAFAHTWGAPAHEIIICFITEPKADALGATPVLSDGKNSAFILCQLRVATFPLDDLPSTPSYSHPRKQLPGPWQF